MDRVRFGRALGYGARHAAKSLKKAAEAAATPSPSAPVRRTATPPSATAPRMSRVIPAPRKLAATKGHARALGRSVWSPLARFSSVLWLQVTGSFFALLALFLSENLWKERIAVMHPIGSHTAEKFYIQLAAFLIFTYFAISNFVRAHLRERR